MDKTVGFLERMIQFAGRRHRVLSSNIANADTPGYRSKDVAFAVEPGDDRPLTMAVTENGHQQAVPVESPPVFAYTEQAPWKDDNNVELDMEVAKMTENDLLYEASVGLLKKKLQMYRKAIRGNL